MLPTSQRASCSSTTESFFIDRSNLWSRSNYIDSVYTWGAILLIDDIPGHLKRNVWNYLA
eukprot:m.983836 g.983836  ORF g.983836 m.983836 type:complete len:60 (+) comp23975_c0_seq8:5395-5574(+)